MKKDSYCRNIQIINTIQNFNHWCKFSSTLNKKFVLHIKNTFEANSPTNGFLQHHHYYGFNSYVWNFGVVLGLATLCG